MLLNDKIGFFCADVPRGLLTCARVAQANMKKRKLGPLCASVKLNVGGRSFETTAETLAACQYFQPFLAGRMPHGGDGKGRLFIDRSPDLFAVLLQFLRTRQRPPESVFANRWALIGECAFFGCEAFATILRGEISPCDLRPECRALRQREQQARCDSCAYQLIDVYKADTTVRRRADLQVPILELSNGARPEIFGTFSDFYTRLNSCGLVDELAEIPGLVIAGGAVLSALVRGSSGDVDIFITVPQCEAEATLRQVFAAVQRSMRKNKGEKLLVTRTKNALTMYRASGARLLAPPVQALVVTLAADMIWYDNLIRGHPPSLRKHGLVAPRLRCGQLLLRFPTRCFLRFHNRARRASSTVRCKHLRHSVVQ